MTNNAQLTPEQLKALYTPTRPFLKPLLKKRKPTPAPLPVQPTQVNCVIDSLPPQEVKVSVDVNYPESATPVDNPLIISMLKGLSAIQAKMAEGKPTEKAATDPIILAMLENYFLTLTFSAHLQLK